MNRLIFIATVTIFAACSNSVPALKQDANRENRSLAGAKSTTKRLENPKLETGVENTHKQLAAKPKLADSYPTAKQEKATPRKAKEPGSKALAENKPWSISETEPRTAFWAYPEFKFRYKFISISGSGNQKTGLAEVVLEEKVSIDQIREITRYFLKDLAELNTQKVIGCNVFFELAAGTAGRKKGSFASAHLYPNRNGGLIGVNNYNYEPVSYKLIYR